MGRIVALAITVASLLATPKLAHAGACGPNTVIPDFLIPYQPGYELGCQLHDACLDGAFGCTTVGQCAQIRDSAWAAFCESIWFDNTIYIACMTIAAGMSEASDYFTCSSWAPTIPGQGCGSGDELVRQCREDIHLCPPCEHSQHTQSPETCACQCVVNGVPIFFSATCGWQQDPCGAWLYFGECPTPCGDNNGDCYDDCTQDVTCQVACGDWNYDCYDDCSSEWACYACGDNNYDCYDDCSYDYTCNGNDFCTYRPWDCPQCQYYIPS